MKLLLKHAVLASDGWKIIWRCKFLNYPASILGHNAVYIFSLFYCINAQKGRKGHVKSEDRRPRGGKQWKKREVNFQVKLKGKREQLGWTSWSQGRTQAQNRSNWHYRIKALCASGREEGTWTRKKAKLFTDGRRVTLSALHFVTSITAGRC